MARDSHFVKKITWDSIVLMARDSLFVVNLRGTLFLMARDSLFVVNLRGTLWERLAKKMRNTTLKTEAPVDYSLRMERLLFRSGWVQGLWKPQVVARDSHFVVNLRGTLYCWWPGITILS